MKKGILICAYGSIGWIGGLYYCKNIAFQLYQNSNIRENYTIHIMYDKENAVHFKDLPEQIKRLEYTHSHKGYWDAIQKKTYILLNNIVLLYPQSYNERFTRSKSISWIADLQHDHYPDYFPKREVLARSSEIQNMAHSDIPIVFSSQNAMADFQKKYCDNRTSDCVMHFVSYISPDLLRMTPELQSSVLDKYKLSDKRYICVANQFWKHKNHIVVLKALQLLTEKEDFDINIVFTGELKDYRNPDYYEELRTLFEKKEIQHRTKVLGFIDRIEQLVIMRNSEFIIQPSLFEGWGTVLEDSKVLDKTVLLSDIPVHREQKNDKCILFSPDSEKELAELILEEWQRPHVDDLEKGIADMYIRAEEYTKDFEVLIDRYI